MLQQNFKKDSRVWLHKNSRRKPSGNETAKLGFDHQNRVRIKTAREDDNFDTIPYITGADGMVYKKDSRTWLHKSSGRIPIKPASDNKALRNCPQVKNPRRMWDVMHKVKELVSREKLAMDSGIPQEGNELVRGVMHGGKRKKNAPRGRSGLSSMSHRDIHIVEECDENGYGTCNPCSDKRARVRYVKGSYSDYDNTNEESSRSDSDGSVSDDVMGMARQDKRHHRLLRRLCECPLTNGSSRHAGLNCNGCDSLPLCRSNASIELTQDGINAVREIAREMQLPPARSFSYLVETPENSLGCADDLPLNPIDLSSSGVCSSKSSLNVVGINLSDECVTALEEQVPETECDYQLSQATKGLKVQSPTGYCRHSGDQEDKTNVAVE